MCLDVYFSMYVYVQFYKLTKYMLEFYVYVPMYVSTVCEQYYKTTKFLLKFHMHDLMYVCMYVRYMCSFTR